MLKPEAVLDYWLKELGPEDWYAGGEALDAEITRRFQDGWEDVMVGGHRDWLTDPHNALAYILLLDQFPRNMFRGTARSFSSDETARAAAKLAIALGHDQQIPEPERQFFYMPLMHSECLSDQDRAVRLIVTRMAKDGGNLLHAKAHREIIRQFGRFPFRNEALSRQSSPAEMAYLKSGGYGATVKALQAA